MKERILYFDVLRAIAIICVVFIHTNGIGYSCESESFNFRSSIYFRQFVNFGVPLFLFISGYFIGQQELGSRNDYFIFLKKQLPRVLLPFFVWSILYIVYWLVIGIGVKVEYFTESPLYYILLILQYYMLLPVLQKCVSSRKSVYFSLCVSLIMCMLIQYLISYKGIKLPLFIYAGNCLTWLIFFVLGIYITKFQPKLNSKLLTVTTLLFYILSNIETYYIFYHFDKIDTAVMALKSSSFLYSISAILLLYSIKEKIVIKRYILTIGKYSFGIYFLHLMALSIVKKACALFLPFEFIYSVPGQIVIVMIVISICCLFGFVINKINKNIAFKYFGF